MANKIRELRVQMQLSQADFARYFEVPIKTLQKWETESSNPPDYVEKLMRRIHTLEEELAGVNILRNICNSTDTDTYILRGSKASSILLQGDGRKLIEIKDDSIACIVTDHPWYDPHNHLAETKRILQTTTALYIQEKISRTSIECLRMVLILQKFYLSERHLIKNT